MVPKEITNFYNKHKTRLYNIALRITGDSFDAEEIVQDTIIKYLRTNSGMMSEPQARAWLTKACVRASIDMLRMRKGLKVKLEKFVEQDDPQDCSQQWDELIEEEDPHDILEQVRRQLLLMPDGYRAVLSLLLFEGYDYSEASDILGVEESTVRSQYLRGKRKLLAMIKDKKDK